MSKNFFIGIATSMAMLTAAISTSAQGSKSTGCRGPVYTRKEVSKPARLLGQADFKALYEALGNDVSVQVKLEAVLCRSGQITDIHVINSEPASAGQFVVGALYLLRFKPAEMNWHTVSQRQQFEFSINPKGISGIDPVKATGRLVEELDIIGNRRTTKDQLLGLIKTRAGDTYNADQIQKDLLAITATGRFDARNTRASLEAGVRGGVRVIFEVVELPLIAELKFAGLRETYQSAIIAEFRQQRVEVQKGAPLDPARLKQAERVIRIFFESQGWRDVKVETLVESLNATEAAVTFKVTAYKFGP